MCMRRTVKDQVIKLIDVLHSVTPDARRIREKAK